jgi:D-glycero-D-manno-heptose 1,7-bisphosphate phosphatase
MKRGNFVKTEKAEKTEVFMSNHAQRYVLLDRDGVINRRVAGGYVTRWEEFEFLPRVLEALRLFAHHGYRVVVISNQACVGKNLVTIAELESITRRFLMEVALAGGNIAQVYYCVHLASDHCDCRKPLPGSINRAQLDYSFVPEATYFVGDSLVDLQAAASAGCPAILVRRDAFLEIHAPGEPVSEVASNLYEAAAMIVARQTHREPRRESPTETARSDRYVYAAQR